MNSQHNNNKYSATNLFLWGKRLYWKIPPWCRWILFPLKGALIVIRAFLFDLWILNGEEINSKHTLGILYAGSKENKNYMANLAFASPYEENYIGSRWIWSVREKIKEEKYNGYLIVIELSIYFRFFIKKNKKWFYIPCWISGETDISKDIASLIANNSVKNDIRKIRKNNLSFEVTNEVSRLHDFYYNMYLPYITEAHKDEAIISEYNYFKEKFKSCSLILIKNKEEYIGGELIYHAGKRARLWILGVKDGNRDYLQQGVIGAMYYYAFCDLKDRGLRKVGLGKSRAFLKDGVLQYKKKWSMQITDATPTGFLVNILPEGNAAKGFFLNNPFIYTDKGKLTGAIFIEKDRLLAENDFRKIYKEYYKLGISKLTIYRYGGGGSLPQETIPQVYRGIIEMRSTESLL